MRPAPTVGCRPGTGQAVFLLASARVFARPVALPAGKWKVVGDQPKTDVAAISQLME